MTTIKLSRVPPSLHKLYGRGRGRTFKTTDYKAWILLSAAEIRLQRPPVFTEAVDILIRLPRDQVRSTADASNRIKAPEDLLVKLGIIRDDSMRYVRKPSAEWADIDMTEIVITPVGSEAA